jgi:hypothetical protein
VQHIFKLEAELLGDERDARERSNVLKDCRASVVESRRLTAALASTTKLIEKQCRESLAFDIFKKGPDSRSARVGSMPLTILTLWSEMRCKSRPLSAVIGNEVGREIAAVELQSFSYLECRLRCFRFFDRHYPSPPTAQFGTGEQ